MTVSEALSFGSKRLSEEGVPDAMNDARRLLSEATGIGFLDFFLKKDENLSEEQEEKYTTFIEKRSKRLPLQLILGYQEFFGFRFSVSSDTLIPRSDTEVLCEEAVRNSTPGIRILDLCTGSGCILISLVKKLKNAYGIGTDISEKAVELAKKNAEALSVSDRTEFFSGDLYDALPKDYQSFDMIVSNPPYIRSGDISELMPEVREHEPLSALDGGEDGLLFYRRIAEKAGDFLSPGGLLLLETGCDEGEDCVKILEENGFSDVRIKKDYAGNDRVSIGRLSSGQS